MILVALGNAVITWLKTGQIPDLLGLWTAIMAGGGLIWAHDPKPSATPAPGIRVNLVLLCLVPVFALCGCGAGGYYVKRVEVGAKMDDSSKDGTIGIEFAPK